MNKECNQRDLVEMVSKALEKAYTVGDVSLIIYCAFEGIKEMLRDKEQLNIENFGTFEKKIKAVKKKGKVIGVDQKVYFKSSNSFLTKE